MKGTICTKKYLFGINLHFRFIHLFFHALKNIRNLESIKSMWCSMDSNSSTHHAHTGEMALSLLSPSPSTLCFLASTSSPSAEFTGQFPRLWTNRSRTGPALPVLTRASSEKDDNKPAFNPFGFVTDNPSSRSAIQMPESPAEDGNVGQMLYVTQFLLLTIFFYLIFKFIVR